MGTGLLSTFRILTWRRPHERCYPTTGVKRGRRGAAVGPCCPPWGATRVSPSPPAACSSPRFPFSFGLVGISTNILPSNFDLLKANAIYDTACDALFLGQFARSCCVRHVAHPGGSCTAAGVSALARSRPALDWALGGLKAQSQAVPGGWDVGTERQRNLRLFRE